MRRILSSFLICTFLISAPVFAGPGHSHSHGDAHSHEPVSASAAIENAKKQIKRLVQKGKIDSSWAAKEAADVEQKQFAKGKEWVVSFKNPSISDSKKQTLYIFLSLDGKYIAANYSGK